MFNDMKMEQVCLAYESKTLRNWVNKYKTKARDYKGNYPKWQERMSECLRERIDVGIASRYLHLARAFVNSRHYRSVENKVRENNRVNVDLLVDELNYWGYFPDRVFVEQWVNS